MTQTGVCKLCENTTELIGSHIIPEFMYKPMYDAKHKFVEINPANRHLVTKHQKGLREYLLCQPCDHRFGQYEDHVKKKVYDVVGAISNPTNVITTQVDYAKFKLFQLSLLWRMGISTRSPFDTLDLGPHADRLRTMLLNRDPGAPHQYGSVLARTSITVVDNDTLMIGPVQRMMDGFRIVFLVTPIITWAIATSSHTQQYSYRGAFVDTSGSLNVSPSDAGIGNEMALALAETLQSYPKPC